MAKKKAKVVPAKVPETEEAKAERLIKQAEKEGRLTRSGSYVRIVGPE